MGDKMLNFNISVFMDFFDAITWLKKLDGLLIFGRRI